MVRRNLTMKRIDPWSVLKFGLVVNVALLFIMLLGAMILWAVVGSLGLVDKFCDSIGELFLDLNDCGLNGGPLFRTLFLMGLLGVVVQTGIMVFGAFLYNLIAELTGGLSFTFLDASGDATLTTPRRADAMTTGRSAPTGSSYVNPGGGYGGGYGGGGYSEPQQDPGSGVTTARGAPPSRTSSATSPPSASRADPATSPTQRSTSRDDAGSEPSGSERPGSSPLWQDR